MIASTVVLRRGDNLLVRHSDLPDQLQVLAMPALFLKRPCEVLRSGNSPGSAAAAVIECVVQALARIGAGLARHDCAPGYAATT